MELTSQVRLVLVFGKLLLEMGKERCRFPPELVPALRLASVGQRQEAKRCRGPRACIIGRRQGASTNWRCP